MRLGQRLSKMLTSHNRRDGSLKKPVALPELDARDAVRFWAKVEVGGADECWPWLASTASGYGQFRAQLPGAAGRHRNLKAHRVAFALSHGPIPDGLSVLHHCDNPICCNPAHIYAGTHKRNMEDAAKRGRLHVPRPGRQLITDAQVDDMVELVRGGAKQCDVARRFGVSKTLVSLLLKGKRRQYRKAA